MVRVDTNLGAILRAVLYAIAGCVLLVPDLTQAGSLGKTVSRSVSRKLLQKAPTEKPKDVIIRRSKHPQAAAHVDAAQRNGQPTVLHVDRSGAAARRGDSVGTVNREPRLRAYDRDEYPPAFTREGGSGSSVRFVDAHDNRGAGASMRAQTQNLPDGAKIRVLVTE